MTKKKIDAKIVKNMKRVVEANMRIDKLQILIESLQKEIIKLIDQGIKLSEVSTR